MLKGAIVMSRTVRSKFLAVLTVIALSAIARAQGVHLDVNDVSFLWPAPDTPGDVSALISADELLIDGKTQLWPRAAFETIIATAETVTIESSSGRLVTISFGEL